MTPRAYMAARALAVDPGATPAERENAATRCAEYEAAHGLQPTSGGIRPWWTLRAARRGDRQWLSNDPEFRSVLRALLRSELLRCYVVDRYTREAFERKLIDWLWFPVEIEDPRNLWQPPKALSEMLRKQQAIRQPDVSLRDCDVVEPVFGKMQDPRAHWKPNATVKPWKPAKPKPKPKPRPPQKKPEPKKTARLMLGGR